MPKILKLYIFFCIQIGDCAVFLSSGQLDRPFIGKVNCMWETNQEKMQVKVFWFYHPEETASDFTGNLPYPVSKIYSNYCDDHCVFLLCYIAL